MTPQFLPANPRDDAAGWEQTVMAFLAEKERRSGSRRTVDSYARILWPFFGRVGSPDKVTPAHVLLWAYGVGASGREPFRQRRDYAIIRFLADSGCRRAEVAGLKVQDLDQTTCQAVVTGKGSKTRTVVYSAATASAIDRYMMARDDHTLASRTDALFLGPTRPLPPDAINAIVQRRAARAGVANHDGTAIHCHMLRHTFAHRSKASGMSEEQIMVLGGWRDHQTMVRYGRSEAAVRAIDAGAKVLLKVGY